jgi:hypothetical protein
MEKYSKIRDQKLQLKQFHQTREGLQGLTSGFATKRRGEFDKI